MKSEQKNREKNSLTLSDIFCKWYVWAILGYALGDLIGSSTTAGIGLVVGCLIGWKIQKYYNKQKN